MTNRQYCFDSLVEFNSKIYVYEFIRIRLGRFNEGKSDYYQAEVAKLTARPSVRPKTFNLTIA